MRQATRRAIKSLFAPKAKGARKKANREEDEIQHQQVRYLTLLENQKRLRFFAVPNGGKRSKVEASIMKGLGVRAGVPDLVILWSRTTENPLIIPGRIGFIENKSEKGVTSDSQDEWLAALRAMNYPVAICRSFQDLLDTLYDWGIISATEAGLQS